MGSEAEEKEQNSVVPSLPLFSVPPMESPERSGMVTPPIYSTASVPFRWEEEPGKPRFTTTATNPLTAISISTDLAQKSLELPPRLLLIDNYNAKLPSPTTVLDGPYMGRPRSQSSSFRMMSKECYGSFSPEKVQLGAVFIRKRWLKERGWFGSWRRRALRGKREVGVGGLVFPSSVDRESEISALAESFNSKVETTRFRRNGSFSSLSQPRAHFWATVCEGFKHVVPWRSKKPKREA